MNQHGSEEDSRVVNPALAARALYIIVFVSGAVLMGLEIAGAKILAPSFGTSTFVWGAIIGMFMGALAAGYYVGGHLADKTPSFRMLAIIVVAASAWIGALPHFGPGLSEKIARNDMGKVFDPLLASMLLFFVPSFLMGMVSPYSVKLNASSLAGVGGVAGRLYALSTFGSIIGTWLTTFMLIPIMKLSNVLHMLAGILGLTALVCLGLFMMACGGVKRKQVPTLGVLLLVWLVGMTVWGAFPVQPKLVGGNRLIHYDDSPYHEIAVTEEVVWYNDQSPDDKDGGNLIPCKMWENDSYIRRWLKFNENIESGTYPYQRKHTNAVTYTDLLHVPLMWMKDTKNLRILVVGGGGGIIPSQYYNWYKSQIDVAEIDGKVAEVAVDFFDMPKDKNGKLIEPPAGGGPGIKFHIGDGRQTIRRELADAKFDVIVLDAYSSGGQIPFHLMTRDFLEEVKGKLKPGGVLITNIISALQNGNSADTRHAADLFLAEYKTLKSTRAEARNEPSGVPADNEPLFKNLYVFPKFYDEDEKMTEGNLEEYRNVIVVATNEETPKTPEALEALAAELSPKMDGLKDRKDVEKALQAATVRCDLKAIVKNYKKLRDNRIPSKDAISQFPVILTDDYAPVDLMYRPVKKDEFTRKIR